jgi:hypothetical protein
MFYQGHTVSSVASLELFFESDQPGDDMAQYMSLIKRENGVSDIFDAMDSLSLPSPINEDTVKKYSDRIYYYVVGAHYYKEFIGSPTD